MTEFYEARPALAGWFTGDRHRWARLLPAPRGRDVTPPAVRDSVVRSWRMPWHGATPTRSFEHLSIQEVGPRIAAAQNGEPIH
jgi:hypothetical protein